MKFDKDFETLLEKELVDVKIKAEEKRNRRKKIRQQNPSILFLSLSGAYRCLGDVKINGKKYEMLGGSNTLVYDINAKRFAKGFSLTLRTPSYEAEFLAVRPYETSEGRLESWFKGKKYYMIPKRETKTVIEEELLGIKGPYFEISTVPQINCKKEEVSTKYPLIWF